MNQPLIARSGDEPTKAQVQGFLEWCGFKFVSQWRIQVWIKVTTRYFTDTAGDIYTA